MTSGQEQDIHHRLWPREDRATDCAIVDNVFDGDEFVQQVEDCEGKVELPACRGKRSSGIGCGFEIVVAITSNTL